MTRAGQSHAKAWNGRPIRVGKGRKKVGDFYDRDWPHKVNWQKSNKPRMLRMTYFLQKDEKNESFIYP